MDTLKCKDCGDKFPANKRGRKRQFCLKCANKPGRRAGYWRDYQRGNMALAEGSRLLCKTCKKNPLVYSGKGAYPKKCEECKAKDSAKYMRSYRRLRAVVQ